MTGQETDPHDSQAPLHLDEAKEALRDAAKRIAVDPQTNSVFSVAQMLFRNLHEGKSGVQDLMTLSREVHLDLARLRCERFREQHGLDGDTTIPQQLKIDLEALAVESFEAFRDAIEAPRGGIVLTGHPTFALSDRLRQAMAEHATQDTTASLAALEAAVAEEGPDWPAQITLIGEHNEVQSALANAQGALSAHARSIFSTARSHFPNTWKSLKPSLPTLASWVGYDLDGRTDIHWSRSVAFRLAEKAMQLSRYADRVDELVKTHGASDALTELKTLFRDAMKATAHQATAFEEDLTVPGSLVAAANLLTGDYKGRLTDLRPVIADLQELAHADETDDALAKDLLVLAAEMDALQLGTARIHLRLNAAQLRTVIRRDLGLETEDRHLGRLAFNELESRAADVEPRQVNFADLLQEQSTARRQFMMCAQILKHIDGGSPIRFLIAEAENPATVMGALFLARQYGVADSLDISPLFETPDALESGARFIARLMESPEYRDYLAGRGYLSVQFGFSDAGRFIGQVAADMAIERLHNLIGEAVAKTMPGLDLLLFNTHGESMGRGAWPGSFKDRFDHVMTPWNRANFARQNLGLRHEVSIQGGDGYLHFGTAELAEATVAAFAQHHLKPVDPKSAEDDPFYGDNAFSWDLYRALRAWHEALFDNPDYGHLLGEFSSGFLVKAGSRQKRRSSGPAGPRALRAISHNATLQQLGIPVNTAAGIGAAIQRETDQLVSLIEASPRLRHLVGLAQTARNLTSVPALRAYGEVHKPALWVALSRRERETAAAVLRRVAYSLDNYQTPVAIQRVADKLSIELGKFDAVMARIEDTPTAETRHEQRLDMHILHAIRVAAMMEAFSRAGRLASVSPRHDTSARDIIAMVTELRITEATEMLRDIFPLEAPGSEVYSGLNEAGHTGSDGEATGYAAIHQEVIEPLEDISALMHQITLAIAQGYGAFG